MTVICITILNFGAPGTLSPTSYSNIVLVVVIKLIYNIIILLDVSESIAYPLSVKVELLQRLST